MMPNPASDSTAEDLHWMQAALAQAQAAHARGDWPTGAVIVKAGALLATGQNQQNTQRNPTLHAETAAIDAAVAQHGAQLLRGATLYCTMEPCPMCAGALQLAGVSRLVLALRHQRLKRTDLGRYSIEAFCALTGYELSLTHGVLEEQYLTLRLLWGGDARQPDSTAPDDTQQGKHP